MNVEKELFKVNKLNIWDHQKDAIREIAFYLASYDGKAYLVKMPTGTGKTGVFACLSRVAYPAFNYIIITPSKALKFQIIEELKTNFWNKIGHPISDLCEQVIDELMPKNADTTIENIRDKNFILVTTIQALQAIAADPKHSKVIEELHKRTDCLVFDEGHKEPAYTWGETVRSFKKPTILFSATPYRNDYKIFNIDKEKFFPLEHKFCEKQNILRSLEIQQIYCDPLTPATFINALVKQVDNLKPSLAKQGIDNPKVIIRCEKDSEIRAIVKSLQSLKKRVIGIHENFSHSRSESPEVPGTEEQAKFDFFVHQFKLIEGIDNPQFCIVALYADFKSTRLLVQQIGRVLRNPARLPNQTAYLFCLSQKKAKEEWESYLEYDDQIVAKQKLFDVTDVLKVNRDVSTLYFSGTFRELIDVSNIDLKETILFQKKVNAFVHDNSKTFDEYSTEILDEWSKRDYSILKQQIEEANTLLILYVIYENSPLVKKGMFIEQKLALTYFSYHKDFIFYYDSEQNSPLFQFDTLIPVSREALAKTFNNKKSITKIFLHNTDIGKRNLRSKELYSNAVESTAPGLADHSYFPARLEGYVSDNNGDSKRRYIGFQFGRITEFSSTRVEFKEYQDWIQNIKGEITSAITSTKMSGFLNRFSNIVDPPQNPVPASILLDIDGELLDQYTFGENKTDIIIDDLCAPVVMGVFTIDINGQVFSFSIDYIEERKRFNISCIELDEATEQVNPNDMTLLGIINSNQSFRIIIEGNQYVYAYKNFYRPGVNLISKKKDLDIKQLFHVHACVSKTQSEKGNELMKSDGIKWHKDSLFGLISRLGQGYSDKSLETKFKFDHMICDDLSNEIADFIAIDTIAKRVVLIHAKAGKSKLSASAFQEICGQATKNLDYLTPYYQTIPSGNLNRWSAPWSHVKVGNASRMVLGSATPKQFWNKYTSLLSDPSVSREVWLIVGNMFDYNAFEKETNKTKIENVTPEVIQLVYLLRSTWDSVSSVGAQLKIFC